jgi:hypothetical protein
VLRKSAMSGWILADIGSEQIIWDEHQVLNMPFVAKMPTGK